MNFTAIDFETANNYSESICAVGIAVVENGKVIQTVGRLVRPIPNYYSKWNIAIHGITSEMTGNQPDFSEIWPEIKPYLENRIVVAHNAAFDIGVLKSVLRRYGIQYPSLEYYCSCVVSRRTFNGLDNHKLSTVCKYLNVPLNHHEAQSDAIGAAQIIIHAGRHTGSVSMNELAINLKLPVKRL